LRKLSASLLSHQRFPSMSLPTLTSNLSSASTARSHLSTLTRQRSMLYSTVSAFITLLMLMSRKASYLSPVATFLALKLCRSISKYYRGLWSRASPNLASLLCARGFKKSPAQSIYRLKNSSRASLTVTQALQRKYLKKLESWDAT